MPASYLVDAHALQHERPVGAIGLLPNTVALVRDGSRTRDRQFLRLMLYLLSYSGRCLCRTRLWHTGSRSLNREATAPPELTSTDRRCIEPKCR
jgi:hypothetical protein